MSKLPNPDTLDWGSMDKQTFKRMELAYELQHEEEGFVKLYIDGKFWKEMPFNQGVRAAATLRKKGKKVEIYG